jgi:hypothetical protein
MHLKSNLLAIINKIFHQCFFVGVRVGNKLLMCLLAVGVPFHERGANVSNCPFVVKAPMSLLTYVTTPLFAAVIKFVLY